MKKEIRRLTFVTIIFFSILIIYLTYIQGIIGNKLYLNSLNPRLALVEQETKRGIIYDRNGKVLADNVLVGDRFERQYPYGPSTALVVGYLSDRFGSSGLEANYKEELLGLTGWQRVRNTLRRLTEKPVQGNNLALTIDADLQRLSTNLLGERRGAVVALDPRTGEVLALASSPNFDPNKLEQEWSWINSPKAGSPLLNRATQGLYPAGSIMKIITATMALEEDLNISDYEFYCSGFIEINGRRLTCPRPHGEVNFNEAMMYSCNVTFANLALKFGVDKFKETAEHYGFGKKIEFDLPLKKSQATTNKMNANALAESAIGQGPVLVTPLQMAMVVGSLAMDGVMMQPYLVKNITNPEGKLIWKARPRPYQIVTRKDVAQKIKEAMIATVNEGTATAAALPNIKVAAKTGSAQNPHGKAHAWLIAFAPAEDPEIAVAVIVENGGSGGVAAAPIARQVMAAALRR
ncbi:MAG: penicillin-binding protein [Clostridia bacterium]|nr:penicillin-binding protein [Clostridia bacterium]